MLIELLLHTRLLDRRKIWHIIFKNYECICDLCFIVTVNCLCEFTSMWFYLMDYGSVMELLADFFFFSSALIRGQRWAELMGWLSESSSSIIRYLHRSFSVSLSVILMKLGMDWMICGQRATKLQTGFWTSINYANCVKGAHKRQRGYFS